MRLSIALIETGMLATLAGAVILFVMARKKELKGGVISSGGDLLISTEAMNTDETKRFLDSATNAVNNRQRNEMVGWGLIILGTALQMIGTGI